MYRMYFRKIRIPVFPEQITMNINGNNKTVNLINSGEVNVIKPTGLTDIKFDLLLPNKKYPFSTYGTGGFKRAWYYLEKLERFKKMKKPFPWIVYRTFPDGKKLYSSSMMVTLEDYTIKEDAKEGFDVVVSISLKQYVSYGVKKVKLVTDSEGTVFVKVKRSRDTLSSVKKKVPTTHKVTENDTIWSIAKYYYNDGLKYGKIWKANKDKMLSPEELVVGTILIIPTYAKE
jgi:LysM domain